MSDLRTLAQAVVSAYETYDGERTASVGRDYIVIDDCRARYYAACKALEAPLDMLSGSIAVASARAILAALNAADAQGYARAMGEVVERCDEYVSENAHRRWDIHTMGGCDRLEAVADWTRERLLAAAGSAPPPVPQIQHPPASADALSAEEARRAAVGAWAAGGGVLHYSPPTEPERPASVKNPMQPLVVKDGVVRFKANEVVRYLLDKGGLTLNDLALQDFSKDDEEQFAQLIGYSVSGFGDLSYVSEETYNKAQELEEKLCLTK